MSTPPKPKRRRKNQRWWTKPHREGERVPYRKKLRVDPKKARKIVALWEALSDMYSVEEFAGIVWDQYPDMRVRAGREEHCEMVAAVIAARLDNSSV